MEVRGPIQDLFHAQRDIEIAESFFPKQIHLNLADDK